MRKFIPILVIVVAGCGSTGRNFFNKSSSSSCGDPCSAPAAPACNSGCNSAPAETMMNEYPISGTTVTGTPVYSE
ncbi:MAG: hypothetical protein ACR2NZ_12645 [Rubripirellula sp.]